ncbi:heme lyase CcmF/NrfE family subunit [Candidatus Chrysopegis kryptomonas]|uniref:Cytochrome c-type biogenesis protein CcmF n=1 Tax=Candidatus Chryseopegocella kryptomonas TaxID=1633643 RepID=A0A0P1MNI0_9BACT|nr:cytochrome c-type biogenesis CcmF C-terminal domain-containing protein [Candidatus Chrysopegis kryptomonas]CUS97024.1 cytochrome c-type biogenesis protein CcmF [Candidatus Chrysopegis kryptomonas]
MLGRILIYIAFTTALFATIGYYLGFRGRKNLINKARISYHISALSVVLASAFLLYLILTHQFQYTYVWSYSSRDLSTPLLISTFYAGQEGSFMLWTFYTAILGLFLMSYARRNGYEPEVMSVYSLVKVFLLLILIVKSPFEYIWETWPGQVHEGFVPPDGRGLNPLLQNFWMVIHPPIIFIGFASMAIPYSHAITALLRREYLTWVKPAMPWTIFSALTLGAGLAIGGFWAYETLGWGGFWGWDPVENSSLVPWLIAVGTIHTMLVQKRTGAFVRWNLGMSILAFILVLYSTFLTRSGVLGDTSVHSFVDPGMWVYSLLISLIVIFTAIGFGLLFARRKEIPKVKVESDLLSREYNLFLASVILVIIAGFVIAGTSSPIITKIFQGKASAVDTSYYNKTTLPLGIIMALLIGLAQVMWWRKTKPEALMKTLMFPTAASTIFTSILIIVGVREILMALFVLTSSFAFFVNLRIAYKIARGNPKFIGASLTHVGVALFLLGVIASTKYDKTQVVSLPKDQPVNVYGYKLTYVGNQKIDKERVAYNVRVEKGEDSFIAPLQMYFSEYNQGVMRHPYIFSLLNYDIFSNPKLPAFLVKNMLMNDLYLSPMSLEKSGGFNPHSTGELIILDKGKEKTIGDYTLKFIRFDMTPDDMAKMMGGQDFAIGAVIEVKYKGKTQQVIPKIHYRNNNPMPEPVKVGDKQLTFVNLNVEGNQIAVSFGDGGINLSESEPVEVLVIEASVKPFINLVWFGVIIVLAGFIISMIRRISEVKKPSKV